MTFFIMPNTKFIIYFILYNFTFFPFIIRSLFIAYITLYLNLLKFWYPLSFILICSIILFIPSICLLDNLLGTGISSFVLGVVKHSSIVINELIISSFKLIKVLPTFMKSYNSEFINKSINSSSSIEQFWKFAVLLNSLYLDVSL